MIFALLALPAGFGLYLLVLSLGERDREIRRFWVARTAIALVVGLLLWKLTPIWTRWDAFLDNPVSLLFMNGGLAALLGGLFSFGAIVGLSVWQARKVKPATRRWPLWTAVLSGALVASALFLAAPSVPTPLKVDAVQMLVPDLAGKPRALAEWRGRVVVLNFWRTSSGGSLADATELGNLVRKSSVQLAVVGVNVASEPKGISGVQTYIGRHRMTWTQLADTDGLLQRAFGVTEVPTTVVLDPSGRLVDRKEGPVDGLWLSSLERRFGTP